MFHMESTVRFLQQCRLEGKGVPFNLLHLGTGRIVKSTARFTPFARGKIVGKAEEGASKNKIRKSVLKKDGRRASVRAIDGVHVQMQICKEKILLLKGAPRS